MSLCKNAQEEDKTLHPWILNKYHPMVARLRTNLEIYVLISLLFANRMTYNLIIPIICMHHKSDILTVNR